jgi:hypothetical protein
MPIPRLHALSLSLAILAGCADDPADDVPSCTVTEGLAEETAQLLCSKDRDDCRICVQEVDQSGKPWKWMVMEDSRCPCPTPSLRPAQ